MSTADRGSGHDRLAAAWLETRLLLRLGGRTIDLDTEPELSRSLAAGGLSLPVVILTAHNPDGLPRARAWNQAANRGLRDRLDRKAWPCCPALGRARSGSWQEAGFAVSGISVAEARALASELGQLAFFWVDEDEVAALAAGGPGRWTRSRGRPVGAGVRVCG